MFLLEHFGDSPLRIVLDPANLIDPTDRYDQRKTIHEACALLGRWIVQAHAKDRRRTGDVVRPGRGVLDWSYYVEALRSCGYDGPLVTHGIAADEAAATAQFLHDLLAA